MFRGCIPKKSGVGASDFTPNDDPIAAGTIGEEGGVKDVVPTSVLLGVDSLNAYLQSPPLFHIGEICYTCFFRLVKY